MVSTGAFPVHGESIASQAFFSEDSIVVQILRPTQSEYAVKVLSATHPSSLSRSASIAINGGSPTAVQVLYDGQVAWVHSPEGSIGLSITHTTSAGQESSAAGDVARITSPIPGKVAALCVGKGESVSAGSVLLVLDSMKMEHPFRAPRDGTVLELEVKAGSIVQAGATLVVIG